LAHRQNLGDERPTQLRLPADQRASEQMTAELSATAQNGFKYFVHGSIFCVNRLRRVRKGYVNKPRRRNQKPSREGWKLEE